MILTCTITYTIEYCSLHNMVFSLKDLQSFIAYMAVAAVYDSGICKDKAARNQSAHLKYVELVEKYNKREGLFGSTAELNLYSYPKTHLLLKVRKGQQALLAEDVWKKGCDVRALVPLFIQQYGKHIEFKQTNKLTSAGEDDDATEIPEIYEELPSGTTMEQLLNSLLLLIYKNKSKTVVDIVSSLEDDLSQEGCGLLISAPNDFVTVEFLIFKYLVCLAKTDKDDFMVSFLIKERPGLKIDGKVVLVAKKSRKELQKEHRLSAAEGNCAIVDLTSNAVTDAQFQQDSKLDSTIDLKALELRLKTLAMMKSFMPPEKYETECTEVYSLIMKRQNIDKENIEDYQQRNKARAEAASKLKLPPAKKIKVEKSDFKTATTTMAQLLDSTNVSNVASSSSLSTPATSPESS